MWSAINKKTGRVRDGFEDQEDAEDFLFDFFKGRATIIGYDEENKVVNYALD
jgi:hypothetical protein